MASTSGLPPRARILSSSAADEATGPGFAETSPESVANDDVPDLDYHKESRERLEQFKQTLAAFQQNLVDRKVDTRFGITIKDAQDYTLDDVLQIANTVQQRNAKLDNVNKCTRGIKKLFRATGRKASTFKKLLAFVPADTYGSAICGGFTMILVALERAESLRDKMYDTLEKIPTTLRKLHGWLDVHHKSVRLRCSADAVLVAVFVLLELIVRQVSGSVTKKIIKAPFQGETYGSNIDEAIATLEASVEEFKDEARLCDAQRLGRIDEVTKATSIATKQLHETAKSTDLRVQQLSEGLADIREHFATRLRLDQASIETRMASSTDEVPDRPKEKGKVLTTEAHGVHVHNVFYCFLTSNPPFDSKMTLRELPTSRVSATLGQAQNNIFPADMLARPAVPKDWGHSSRRIRKIAIRDLVGCFQDLGYKPNVAEQNRITFILVSDEVRAYLRSTVSKLLVVEERKCDRDEYSTPASYASAVLIRAVQKIGTFPIVYHFCVPRASDPNRKNDLLAGGRGLLTSLASQLLGHLKDTHGVDLDFLSARRNRFESAIEHSDRLLLILEELLRRVPKSTCVYIVIDAVWKLQDEGEDQCVLDGLLGLVNDEDFFVKILVTHPSSLDILDPLENEEAKQRKRAKKAKEAVPSESSLLTLHVPEYVDGGHHDFNTSWVEEEIKEVTRGCLDLSQASSAARKSKSKSKKKTKKKQRKYASSQSDTSSSDSDDTDDSGYA